MKGMTSGWAYSGYNSDNPVLYTWEWDLPASFTVGQTYVRAYDWGNGDNIFWTGVIRYRYFPPSGPAQDVDFADPSDVFGWAPYVYADACIGITFGTWVGSQSELWVVGNLFFW